MIAAAIFLAACGSDEMAKAKGGERLLSTPDTGVRQQMAVQRAVVKEQRQKVGKAEKETRCIKAYLTDMRTQQQGFSPDWSQPGMEAYMKAECVPLLAEDKSGRGSDPGTGL